MIIYVFQWKLYLGLAVLTTCSFALIHCGEYMEHSSDSQEAQMNSCELYILLQEWGWGCGIFTSD